MSTLDGQPVVWIWRTPSGRAPRRFTVAGAERAQAFHRSLPGYQPTPLVPLRDLAARLGLTALHVKDESGRFGQQAFKVLGGSFCLHRCMEEGWDLHEPGAQQCREQQCREQQCCEPQHRGTQPEAAGSAPSCPGSAHGGQGSGASALRASALRVSALRVVPPGQGSCAGHPCTLQSVIDPSGAPQPAAGREPLPGAGAADAAPPAQPRRTVVTATDGNHGRGIAWSASRLGLGCVVYLPRGSAPERVEAIRTLGAQAVVTDWNYDETVRFASRQAERYGWVLVQDTSWEGYEQIPAWIMQGYTTMGLEIARQLDRPPTHIFLQAGVGAMAGALCGFFADCYAAARPVITIVEPHQANCLFQTARHDDGRLHRVDGELRTIMAGLACGEPCHLGWEQIRAHASCFVSTSDAVAATGMRVLGNPAGTDARIVSGESGAVTTGLVYAIMRDPALGDLRRQLRLDGQSRVLCLSTEGDTDREHYRRIVWDGLY